MHFEIKYFLLEFYYETEKIENINNTKVYPAKNR